MSNETVPVRRLARADDPEIALLTSFSNTAHRHLA